ncbi:MAG: RNA polymerase sigma factor [Opitutales bacterium]
MQLFDEDDNALALRAQSGDLGAFDELVRRYQQDLARILYRFHHYDAAGLEDAVQESLIHAYNKLSKWSPQRGEFGPWLRQLTYRLGLDRLRKQKRNPISKWLRKDTEQEDLALQNLAAESQTSDTSISPSETLEPILSSLKPEEKTVICLFYFEDLSIDEIAQSLNWSRSKTKVVAHRTRKKLKSTLERHGYSTIEQIL